MTFLQSLPKLYNSDNNEGSEHSLSQHKKEMLESEVWMMTSSGLEELFLLIFFWVDISKLITCFPQERTHFSMSKNLFLHCAYIYRYLFIVLLNIIVQGHLFRCIIVEHAFDNEFCLSGM